MEHRVGGPGRGLIRMAGRAWVRDLVFVRHRRCYEREGVSTHENTWNRDLNLGHVACNAFAA